MFIQKQFIYILIRSVLSSLSVLFSLSISPNLIASAVVPDGSTVTHTSQNSNGLIEIQIAPSKHDRTSYNRYSQFDVNDAGITLNNRETAARTIVNEVVGGNISHINGQIEILGTRAHLVIANTNGVSINGAKFINTADTIISTGVVSQVVRQLGPGVAQANTLLETAVGQITIGEQGLSGAMSSLDLIANKIQINGPVINNNAGRRAQVRIFAGTSKAELDSSLSPANPSRSAAIVATGAEVNESILISMNENGILDAGSIYIGVTAKGAGVRLDGQLIARSGDLTLDVDGNLTSKANIQAAGAINITAADDVSFVADMAKTQTEVSAGVGVNISSGGKFTNIGVQITGSAFAGLSTEGINIQAADGLDISSLDSEHLGILFASKGDLNLTSSADINNFNGRILGNSNVTIETKGNFNNRVSFNDFEGRGVFHRIETEGSRRWFTLFLKKDKKVEMWADYGQLDIPGEIPVVVADGNLNITAGKAINNIGGDFLSNAGQLNLNAQSIRNEAIATGQLNYYSRCHIGCDRWGSSNIKLNGGNIKAAKEITINADGEFYDLGGVVLGLGDTTVNSPKITIEAITVPSVFSRTKGLVGFFDFGLARIFRQDQGGSLVSNMGNLILNSDNPVRLIGAELGSGQTEIIPGGTVVVRERVNESPVVGESIGFLGGGQ